MTTWKVIYKEIDRIESAVAFLQVKIEEAELEAKETEKSIDAKDAIIAELQSEIDYLKKHGGRA